MGREEYNNKHGPRNKVAQKMLQTEVLLRGAWTITFQAGELVGRDDSMESL